MEENVISMQEIFAFNKKGIGPTARSLAPSSRHISVPASSTSSASRHYPAPKPVRARNAGQLKREEVDRYDVDSCSCICRSVFGCCIGGERLHGRRPAGKAGHRHPRLGSGHRKRGSAQRDSQSSQERQAQHHSLAQSSAAQTPDRTLLRACSHRPISSGQWAACSRCASSVLLFRPTCSIGARAPCRWPFWSERSWASCRSPLRCSNAVTLRQVREGAPGSSRYDGQRPPRRTQPHRRDGLVARESPDPIGTEFRICFEEQNYGLEMKTAIDNLLNRIPCRILESLRLRS